MNIINTARKAKSMTQAEFGKWLAKEVGRDAPFSESRISEWENGKYSPRKKIREAVALPVSIAFTTNLIDEALAMLGHQRMDGQALPPDLRVLRDNFAEHLAAMLGDTRFKS